MTSPIVPQPKQCSKCKLEFPATTEYFDRQRTKLSNTCKACRRARNNRYNAEHRDEIRAYHARYYAGHRDEILARVRTYYTEHRDDTRIYKARYNATHRDKTHAYKVRYNIEHRDEKRAYNNRYNNEHRDARRAYRVRHYAENPGVKKAAEHRRWARKKQLPADFSATEWTRCLDYFHGCCAACGRQLTDLFGDHKAAGDHWIALKDPRPDNPGTVATNIVPLCHGVGGCNNSKKNKNPLEWLEQRFGKRKGRDIQKRIEAYFAWVVNQDKGGD